MNLRNSSSSITGLKIRRRVYCIDDRINFFIPRPESDLDLSLADIFVFP
ncbi:MAG: hypothetical protein K6A80_02730 [Saccharofermentans sp.]|nr:hypothetical protein [Saccharofermentans sp.]